MEEQTPEQQRIHELQTRIAELEAHHTAHISIISELEACNTSHVSTISELEAEVLRQRLTIDELKRKLYGRKSEKKPKRSKQPQQTKPDSTASDSAPDQVEDVCQQEVDRDVVETTTTRKRFLDRDALPHGEEEVSLGILNPALERKTVTIDTKPSGWNQEECVALAPKITERLVVVPAHVYVERIVRPVWAHRPTGTVMPVAPLRHVFDRCSVSESVIIHIVLNRFLYHIPYYRQEKMFAAMGVSISRDTMIRWCNDLAFLFAPIVTALEQVVKESPVIQIDETPYVGKPTKASPYKRHLYFWPLLAPGIGLVFRWSETRDNETAQSILSGISPKTSLLCDGINIYQHCADVYELFLQLCWAHVRRKFHEALPSHETLATKALSDIGTIFHAEATILKAKPAPPQLLTRRHQEVKPLVDTFISWVQEISTLPGVVTDATLNRACQYLLKRTNEACHFLENPYILMHNNDNERESKNFKLGAKNWLFTSSPEGANALSVFYSLIRTAQMHQIHPFYYLLDLCTRISQPGLTSRDLIPQRWKEKFFDHTVPSQYQ